jgi:hypothetical protein
VYLILKNKKIIAIDQNKDGYNPLFFEAIPWATKISGPFPKISGRGTEVDEVEEDPDFIDDRGYAEKRQCAYALELDPILPEMLGRLEDGDESAEAKANWKAKRAEIKAKYPKP